MAVCYLLVAPPSNTPLTFEGGTESRNGSQQKETFGGYDCEFAEQPTRCFQTHCPICTMILRDPRQSKCCGENFCCSCIKQVRAKRKPCPTCRKDSFEVFEDKGLKQSLIQLHVFCSEGGCKWNGELGELEHHLSEVTHPGKLFSLVGSHISDVTENDRMVGKKFMKI